jgi:hypothetical protein
MGAIRALHGTPFCVELIDTPPRVGPRTGLDEMEQ